MVDWLVGATLTSSEKLENLKKNSTET